MKLNGAGFKNGAIILDDPNPVYYPAQTISGKIEFELQKPLPFSAINVIYQGEANLSWTEQQTQKYSGVKRYINVEYKANEEYFNFTQCVYGGNGTSLQAGPHSIPFSYQIPYTAPSSFQSTIGGVTYKIIAYLECPPVMREKLVKTFEIVAPLDLNKDTTGEIKRPINMEFEEVYNCCCRSQLITVGVNLPVSGYCPGQAMPITIDVKNDSNMEISKIRFQLVMKESYHSRNPVSDNVLPEKVLATTKKGPIRGKIRRQYQCDLKVPDMIAPNLDNCSIIDVRYFFKVTIKLPGCMDDIEDESEVYLGMIPLEITTGGNAYIHPLKYRLPRGLPPLGIPVPYGNNNGMNLPNLITHIPLKSPQISQNHTNPSIFHPVTTSAQSVYPYQVSNQFLPSAPMEPNSPYSVNSYSGQSSFNNQTSRSPVYPYPVQHQTLVTASIETNSHIVSSYQVQNQSPVNTGVSASSHSVNYQVKNQVPVSSVIPPGPDSVYNNQFQSPTSLTNSMDRQGSPVPIHIQTTSPHVVQNQSPQTTSIQSTSPHPINSGTVETVTPSHASIETATTHTLNSHPDQNQSPQTVHIETSSPHLVQNQSPITAPIDTISPHQESPVIIQSPPTTPKETTSPHSVNSNPSPQLVHTYLIKNQSLPSIPMRPISPYSVKSYSGQSPLNHRTRSASPIYPYPVQHQTFVTDSIETTKPPIVSSYQVQNQSPVNPAVSASSQSLNYQIKNQVPVISVIPPSPDSVYNNQYQSPTSLTNSIDRQRSPVLVQPQIHSSNPVLNQSPVNTAASASSHSVNYQVPVISVIPPSPDSVYNNQFQSPTSN